MEKKARWKHRAPTYSKDYAAYSITDPSQAAQRRAAAFAKTLDESDESFALRFGDNLRELYATMREAESPSTGVLETLKWTQELLK